MIVCCDGFPSIDSELGGIEHGKMELNNQGLHTPIVPASLTLSDKFLVTSSDLRDPLTMKTNADRCTSITQVVFYQPVIRGPK